MTDIQINWKFILTKDATNNYCRLIFCLSGEKNPEYVGIKIIVEEGSDQILIESAKISESGNGIRVLWINIYLRKETQRLHKVTIAYAKKTETQTELEKYFTVVLWEQRGTGKSYSDELTPEMMTIDRMVRDAGEVMKFLLEKFQKPKLFLVGHSWGSMLGDTQAVKELKQISATFEYPTIEGNPNWYQDVVTERKWLVKFGGEAVGRSDVSAIYVIPGILPSEYTIMDFIHFGQGSQFSLQTLWPQVMEVNLMESAARLEVPVLFLQGRHDCNTPSALVEEYYDLLDAPHKELIWFENSGHHPMYEEAKLYDAVLIEKLLPLAE